MKLQIITEPLRSDLDLNDLPIDKVAQLLEPDIATKYHNIRFDVDYNGDYENAEKTIGIVGDRFETHAEAKKRIEAVKKERDRKKTAKMSKIERLESELAKLKGKS